MNWTKCLLEVKVLRLLIVFGTLSTTIVLATYYLTSRNYDIDGKYNQVLTTSNTAMLRQVQLKEIQNPSSTMRQAPKAIVSNRLDKINRAEYRSHSIREKVKRLTSSHTLNSGPPVKFNAKKNPKFFTQNVHIFYSIPVNWYQINADMRIQTKADQPNIVFYPMLGLYKTENNILTHHFENIKKLGATVLIVTWSPTFQKYFLRYLLDETLKFQLKIAIEIDDYPNRTVYSIFNDVDYFYKEFWDHDSFYKVFVLPKHKYVPMFYVKNVSSIPASDWSKLLTQNGAISMRRSLHDGIFIGHISTKKQVSLIKTTNFNGFYSRTPSNGATYTSTWKNWAALKKSADKFKLIFIATVGPGYNENRKQPKTGSTRRHRTNGQYYGVAWRSAISMGAEFINIASYNDWISGTQIEEAISKNGYKDYTPGTPTKYLDLTRHWIEQFVQIGIDSTKHNVETTADCCKYFNNTIC